MLKIADWEYRSFTTKVYGAMDQRQFPKDKEICNIYSATLHQGSPIAVKLTGKGLKPLVNANRIFQDA
jgi:hypothetical protein